MHKSVRWVYGNAAALGGVKVGGSWIFTEEGLVNALQGAGRLEGRSDGPGEQVGKVVSIESRRPCVGNRSKKRIKEASFNDNHGLIEYVR
jgi:hypothetical protein